MSGGAERGATLVVRAWREEGGLRVRVVEVGGAPGDERTRCTTTAVAEATAAVAAWLQEVAGERPSPPSSQR